MTSGRPLKIFFDGGCRPNLGRIEVAVVVRGQLYFFDDLGEGSSSEAEWLALCKALEVAGTLGLADFVLLGDSLSIVQQASGHVPFREALASAHYGEASALIAQLKPRRIRWVPRHQNLAGIALEQRRNFAASSNRAPRA